MRKRQQYGPGILRGMQEEMHINWLQEVASRNI